MIEEHFFDDRESLVAALTARCSESLQQACQQRGSASFVISGGSTPKPLYQNLASQQLPWQQIQVALVDERWVSPQNPGSNQTFVSTNLLQQHAAAAQFIEMKTEHATATEALADREQAYQAMGEQFDLTILGMGNDGHTASLFPVSQGLTEALDPDSSQRLAAITANKSEVTGDYLERITLSLAGILASRELILLITGEQKLEVLRQAQQASNIEQTPISAVLQQTRVPVHVYWAP